MNFDKFKKINSPDIQFSPDGEYVNKLNELPREKHKVKILPILSTVAAALAVIVGVTAWALVGRGVRNLGDNVSAGTQDYSEYTEGVPDQMSFDVTYRSKFFGVPIFDEQHRPSVTELTFWYNNVTHGLPFFMENYEEGDKSPETLAAAVEEYFGFKYDLDYDRKAYVSDQYLHDGIPTPTIDRFLYKGTEDNPTECLIIYTCEGVQYELRYLPDPNRYTIPTKYLSHKIVGQPIEKDYSADYMYYTVKNYILTDERVTSVELFLEDVQKISDTRYTCIPRICDLEVTDTSRHLKILNDANKMICGPLYIDIKDGEYVISDYQPNAYKPDYSNTTNVAKFIIEHGLVEMAEFESGMIAASDTKPQSEDIKFDPGTGSSYTPEPNADGYYACQIDFDYDGKMYFVGYLTKENPEPKDSFTPLPKAEYFIFKKELGSYTGTELKAYK